MPHETNWCSSDRPRKSASVVYAVTSEAGLHAPGLHADPVFLTCIRSRYLRPGVAICIDAHDIHGKLFLELLPPLRGTAVAVRGIPEPHRLGGVMESQIRRIMLFDSTIAPRVSVTRKEAAAVSGSAFSFPQTRPVITTVVQYPRAIIRTQYC